MSQRSLLSISEASRMLGIREATLRQWTDAGKIRAFVTPGGHRRYSKNEGGTKRTRYRGHTPGNTYHG